MTEDEFERIACRLCARCGEALLADETSCRQCGSARPWHSDVRRPNPTAMPSAIMWIVVCGAISAAGGAASLFTPWLWPVAVLAFVVAFALWITAFVLIRDRLSIDRRWVCELVSPGWASVATVESNGPNVLIRGRRRVDDDVCVVPSGLREEFSWFTAERAAYAAQRAEQGVAVPEIGARLRPCDQRFCAVVVSGFALRGLLALRQHRVESWERRNAGAEAINAVERAVGCLCLDEDPPPESFDGLWPLEDQSAWSRTFEGAIAVSLRFHRQRARAGAPRFAGSPQTLVCPQQPRELIEGIVFPDDRRTLTWKSHIYACIRAIPADEEDDAWKRWQALCARAEFLQWCDRLLATDRWSQEHGKPPRAAGNTPTAG